MSRENDGDDRVALFDLDGSMADYDTAMSQQMRLLQGPGEEPYLHRYPDGQEPAYIEARRKLIQRQPGFWRGLKPLVLGFEVYATVIDIGFTPHVLTKGPTSAPNAWSEKLEWCQAHMPGVAVTLAGDKSLVYGRVLYDDFPPYFVPWLAKRPRGLAVCLAQPWNVDYAPGGPKEHPQVVRYDGTARAHRELKARLQQAFDRKATV